MSIRFQYRAATPEGRMLEGVVQAASPRSALDELRRQRLYPVDLARMAAARAPKRRADALARGPAVALFARTVATLLSAGVPLDRALSFGAEQARHPDIEAAARAVLTDVREGRGLAEAARRHPGVFGSFFVAAVSAGEESGTLDEAMARLADHLDESEELRSQLHSALLYPALMAVVSGLGVAVLLLFVMPRFAAMIAEEGGTLPLSTRALVGLSGILLESGWALPLAALTSALGARAWLARTGNRRRLHAWRLAWPLVGELERKHATAVFTRAFALLLRSGRPTVPSLDAARGAVANLAIAAGLERAAEAVSRGEPVHAALRGSLPALAIELLAVGEESGRLDELGLRVAETYEREVRRSLRALVGVVEPALILMFAVVVGFVALAMLQAIYGASATAL
ncbi:MAG: type II secretion system F family protein [Gemmatimonadetes bacterium]|nr:type II secretion system F family protein [Gemmatimonadota bacterium]